MKRSQRALHRLGFAPRNLPPLTREDVAALGPQHNKRAERLRKRFIEQYGDPTDQPRNFTFTVEMAAALRKIEEEME